MRPYPSMLSVSGRRRPHIVAGAAGYAAYSRDGVTWTQASTINGGADAYAIGYDGATRAIVIGSAGLSYSDNGGATWTTIAFSVSGGSVGSISASGGARIVCGLGAWYLVAPESVGQFISVFRSTTGGLTWTLVASYSTGTVRGISYDGASRIDFTYDGSVERVYSTTDGTTWTPVQVSSGGSLRSVAYSPTNALFILTNAASTVYSWIGSGTTFNTAYTTSFTIATSGLAYSKRLRLFLVVGSGDATATSPDGVTWTAHASATGTGNAFTAVEWSGSMFIATMSDDDIYTSADGLTWTHRTTPGTPAFTAAQIL